MRTIRRWIRSFFGFSRTETNGFLILLPLLLLIAVSAPVYRWLKYRETPDHTKDVMTLDSILARWEAEDARQRADEEPFLLAFDFDPNTASSDTLIQLGFPRQVAEHLTGYRDHGGHFRIKTDLLRIYGLDTALYQKLESHILLPDSFIRRPPSRNPQSESAVVREVESTRPAPFDLNAVDSIGLKAVRGIGPVLSARIVKYRSLLGGFVRRDQFHEVYGLDSAVIEGLLLMGFIRKDFQPHKVNINRATAYQMSSHPYISRRVAEAIVAYRFQHGAFNRVDDLLGLKIIDSVNLIKIRPYLDTEDSK